MCDRPLPGCSSRACSHRPEEVMAWTGVRNARESHQKENGNEVSAMTSNRTILITGVTGNQGGAVAQALQGAGFHLRGLTRKPDSERAAALARHGVDIVKGDLDDEATLRSALAGAWEIGRAS